MDAEVLLKISFGKVRHHLGLWSCAPWYMSNSRNMLKLVILLGEILLFWHSGNKNHGLLVVRIHFEGCLLMATINRNDVICRTAHQQPKFNAIVKGRKQFKNYIWRELHEWPDQTRPDPIQYLVGQHIFEIEQNFDCCFNVNCWIVAEEHSICGVKEPGIMILQWIAVVAI